MQKKTLGYVVVTDRGLMHLDEGTAGKIHNENNTLWFGRRATLFSSAREARNAIARSKRRSIRLTKQRGPGFEHVWLQTAYVVPIM